MMNSPRAIVRRTMPLLAGGLLAVAGCNADDLTDVLPGNEIVDPKALESSNGAFLLYKAAMDAFGPPFSGANGGNGDGADGPYTLASGQFSDELTVRGNLNGTELVDQRDLPEAGGSDIVAPTFVSLNTFRTVAQQGIGALQKYGQAFPPAFIGQLMAYQAFTEIMLSEMFCSGIPLTTAPYGGNITFGIPRTTAEVNEHALALLDSALTYSADSARILNMVRVGRGRALLNLGRFTEAAAAVSAVPTTFVHLIAYIAAPGFNPPNFPNVFRKQQFNDSFSVADTQGTNGLNYVTAGDAARGANRDPRVMTVIRRDPFVFSTEYRYPVRFDTAGGTPMPIADGIEARLIEAEAALKANDIATWTAKLNELRAAATTLPGFTPRLTAMPALTADSTTTASATRRVDVMFRERAFWLFLTGHRLGDMRRLIRQYGRTEDKVFPVGSWIVNPTLQYGTDVNAPLPIGELLNPNFKGCFDREA